MALEAIFIGKIFLAGFLGAIVGIERDISGRPAGIRTNLIISVSSCLFTILSSEAFDSHAQGYDPTRIASQIVTGVGFLGAGALLIQRDRVIGLTTAATIWLVAAIGMAVGVGMYGLATFVTFFTVVALIGLAPLSHHLTRYGTSIRALGDDELPRKRHKAHHRLKKWPH